MQQMPEFLLIEFVVSPYINFLFDVENKAVTGRLLCKRIVFIGLGAKSRKQGGCFAVRHRAASPRLVVICVLRFPALRAGLKLRVAPAALKKPKATGAAVACFYSTSSMTNWEGNSDNKILARFGLFSET